MAEKKHRHLPKSLKYRYFRERERERFHVFNWTILIRLTVKYFDTLNCTVFKIYTRNSFKNQMRGALLLM